MSKNTNIWEIIKKKKVDRTTLEQAVLDDWVCKWFGPPIRIIIFPVMLLVKLYKWTYDNNDD